MMQSGAGNEGEPLSEFWPGFEMERLSVVSDSDEVQTGDTRTVSCEIIDGAHVSLYPGRELTTENREKVQKFIDLLNGREK